VTLLNQYIVGSSLGNHRVGIKADDFPINTDILIGLANSKEPGKYEFNCYNSSDSTDYTIAFSDTDGAGEVQQTQILVPVSNMATLTTLATDFALGDVTVTPFTTTLPTFTGGTPGTILGNWLLRGIMIGGAGILFTTGAVPSIKYCSFNWTGKSGNLSTVGSIVVTNDTQQPVNVSANVRWDNPATGSTLEFTVKAGATQTQTLPNNESAINQVNISAFAPGDSISPDVQRGLYEAYAEANKKHGVVLRKVHRKVIVNPSKDIFMSLSHEDKLLLVKLAPFLEKVDEATVMKTLLPRVADIVRKVGGPYQVSVLAPQFKASFGCTRN